MHRTFAARGAVVALIALLVACVATRPGVRGPALADGSRATLAILESTDIHSNILSYDYYKLAPDPSLGLERMATLVVNARAEFPNTLLFDAGDTIQGTALADYQALVKPAACGEELAVYRAMDTLHYDGGTIGNHEFNYGLPFLAQVTDDPMNVAGGAPRRCAGPHYPLVLANVASARDGKPIYPPYAVLDRRLRITAADGRVVEAPIRIGILGFTPPSIMQWDRRNLEGKVTVTGVVETADEYVQALRAKGVDLVIAIEHGGIDTAPYTPRMENAGWYLAGVPGVDVLLLGHSHLPFPDPGNPESRFDNLPGVDNVRGFIRGKPAVMGNFWGRSLGVIELALVRKDGRWTIDTEHTHSEVRNICTRGACVAPDPAIAKLVAPIHAATVAYVKTPIGDSDFALTSYFADVGDVSALQIVNEAQRDYVVRYLKSNLPQYANLPVLSAAAPFKGGFGGPNDYTDVPAGALAIRNAADLYLYPNTLTAVKIDGAGLKAWLEHSASRFNRIDPTRSAAQELINRKFPSYDFDVIQGGIRYAIDVTKPAGRRIVDLRYRGRPVDPQQAFIVATNNYRASGGGGFSGLDGRSIVISAPDANRDVLIDYVRARRHLSRTADASDRNWRFAPARTHGPVVFAATAGKLGVARADGLEYVRSVKNNGNGTATYAIDLAR